MRRRTSGMTLVELLIAVGIVGILAGIAYPSYQQYVRRGGRTEAKALLMQQAQALEKCYTRFGRYDDAVNCTAAAGTRTTEGGRYQVTVATPTPTTFVLTATPQGSQVDPDCGVLTLNETGARTRSGTDTLQRCW